MFEIDTPEGSAYVQFSHQNREFGHLLRVLPGIYRERPPSFSELVLLEERFYVFFPLAAALAQGIVRHVASEVVPPQAQKFPLMRKAGWRDGSGKVLNWWLWDGEREWQVEKLTPELESLSLAQIWNDTLLVERIVEGWSPSASPSDQSVDREQVESSNSAAPPLAGDGAALSDLQRAGSDLRLPHRVRHYLYFPHERAATKAAEVLRSEGFDVEVNQATDDPTWLALATHSLTPTIEVISGARSKLERLATSLRGEYDGWEAAIVK